MQKYTFVEKEYRKKIYGNRKGVSFAVLIFVVIILVGLAFLFMPKQKTKYIYFVQVGEFLTYSEANSTAKDIQQKNGAGYIYFDGSYHVFASLYLTFEDADSVKNNLINEYAAASIFQLEIKSFSTNKALTTDQNDCVKNFLFTSYNCLIKTYNNIIGFDKNEINEPQLKSNFISIANEYNEQCDNFLSSFNYNSKYNKAKGYAAEMKQVIENLTEITAEQNFNYKLKYEMIKFAINYYNTSNCF